MLRIKLLFSMTSLLVWTIRRFTLNRGYSVAVFEGSPIRHNNAPRTLINNTALAYNEQKVSWPGISVVYWFNVLILLVATKLSRNLQTCLIIVRFDSRLPPVDATRVNMRDWVLEKVNYPNAFYFDSGLLICRIIFSIFATCNVFFVLVICCITPCLFSV